MIRPNVFFGQRENLLVFSGTVETILTQDTQIASSELVIAVFPEFHHVALFMDYTLYPTTFYQSGVYASDEHIKTEMIKVRTTIDFKPAVDIGCYRSKHCPLFSTKNKNKDTP